MIKNSLMKFIDSCVGNIARKIEDEFRESDHPRDKGGKFTSKGNEGRGGGKQEKSSSSKPMSISVSAGGDTEGLKEEAAEYGVKARIGSSSHGETSVKLSGAKEDIRRYLEEKFYGSEEEAREFSPEAYEESEGSEEDDDEGYMGVSKEELAEEEEYENARERARKEKDDDRVTGPEDRDYMNEEGDDDDPYKYEYEEGTSTTNLYGDKKQAPAVINALQHQYDGDAKKVGYIVRHLNSVTTNPEIWGEYTVKEIIDDIEDRYGKLDSMAKRHIDTYLRKTKPSEWDSETEYWKQKNKDFPGPKTPSFYE